MNAIAHPWTTHAAHIPLDARKVFVAGAGSDAFARALAESRTVPHISFVPALLPIPAQLAGQSKSFDAIILCADGETPESCAAAAEKLLPLLKEFGGLFLLLSNPEFHALQRRSPRKHPFTLDHFASAIVGAGMGLYRHWTVDDDAFLARYPEVPFLITDEGIPIGAATEDERARLACSDVLMHFVKLGYTLLGHAQFLRAEGRSDLGFLIVNDASPDHNGAHAIDATLWDEKLRCLLEYMNCETSPDTAEYALCANHIFRQIAFIDPSMTSAYRSMAAFWSAAGCDDMAERLLRTAHQIQPDELIERQRAGVRPAIAPPPMEPPEWNETWKPRLLYLLHPRLHYGIDVLYDGLVETLGAERVVEFPYKPILHGVEPTEFRNYPSKCNHPGRDYSLAEILAELRAGAFDGILHGDCEGALDAGVEKAIFDAASSVPYVIVDQLDEFTNLRGNVETRVGRPAAAYFKREFLPGLRYGPHAYPMPFAYPGSRADAAFSEQRPDFFFWAGNRGASLRRLFLERIETRLRRRFDTEYNQDSYLRAMRSARVGLNCFGFGFDTVRYWELPAHGCLLLSERLPIVIPHDFKDGETAVFFDDLASLETVLSALRDAPEECERIARAGHEHFWKYHSSRARAGQLLGWMQQILSG